MGRRSARWELGITGECDEGLQDGVNELRRAKIRRKYGRAGGAISIFSSVEFEEIREVVAEWGPVWPVGIAR